MVLLIGDSTRYVIQNFRSMMICALQPCTVKIHSVDNIPDLKHIFSILCVCMCK